MCNPIISFSYLDQEIKSWGSFSLENALLAPSRPRFFISKSDSLNTTNLQTNNEKSFVETRKKKDKQIQHSRQFIVLPSLKE